MQKITCLMLAIILITGSCKNRKQPEISQEEMILVRQGREDLATLTSMYSDRAGWERRKSLLKDQILKGAGLWPLPEKTPLNPVFSQKRLYKGYSVENVSFESIPGYFVCGNLYRPAVEDAKHPVVLCPHGHFQGDSLGAWGRFRPDQQKRCATMARMGAIVFSYSMYGWGGEPVWQLDTTAIIEKPDRDIVRKNHEDPIAISMQTWNSIRALDFLGSLPDADMGRVAVTGASGGGTQAFLLTAVDDRITVSIPVVMVSAYFTDLCVCEKVRPSEEYDDQILNMAEFAAMAAPRPMLIISDGDDWTKLTPELEFPFIRRTYSFYDAADNVENVHFPGGRHDYNYDKRVPVYRFLAKHMELNLEAVKGDNGSVDESASVCENPLKMLVFSSENPFPRYALRGRTAIENELKNLQH